MKAHTRALPSWKEYEFLGFQAVDDGLPVVPFCALDEGVRVASAARELQHGERSVATGQLRHKLAQQRDGLVVRAGVLVRGVTPDARIAQMPLADPALKLGIRRVQAKHEQPQRHHHVV